MSTEKCRARSLRVKISVLYVAGTTVYHTNSARTDELFVLKPEHRELDAIYSTTPQDIVALYSNKDANVLLFSAENGYLCFPDVQRQVLEKNRGVHVEDAL